MITQTAKMLACTVKDGSLIDWQLALLDLAILHEKLSPQGIELNFCLQEKEVVQ